MNKRNLIISAIANYSFDDIKLWVNSVDTNCGECDKIVLCYNIPFETKKILKDRGYIVFEGVLNTQVVIQRFHDMWHILNQIKSNYQYIITTDVKDAVFTSNPFIWIETHIGDKSIVISSENLKYKDEEWGKTNIDMCYGGIVREWIMEECIFNAGVIAGKIDRVSQLFLLIYLISKASVSYSPDQAAFNILLSTKLLENEIFCPTELDAWVAQLGTTLDPTRIGYNGKHLEPLPVIDGDRLLNSINKEYVIIHQYDRVPLITNIIKNKYI